MKNIKLFILAFLISAISIAQGGFNYKALIKDANGDALISQTVIIQFQILEGGTTVIYQDLQAANTDANGILIANIGEGAPQVGTFSEIDWSTDDHFLNVQVNIGNGFIDLGTTQFKSVPYAENARTAQTVKQLPLTNPKYPNGFIGASSITINLDTGNYTVPAGKNFYVTNLLVSSGNTSRFTITRNGVFFNMTTGFYNAENNTASGGFEKILTIPIILKANDVLSGPGFGFTRINGFLIDEGSVESILISPVNGNDFVVPPGKMFVITNFWSPEQTGIAINGINVYFSRNNALLTSNESDEPLFFHSFENPIFVDEGDTVTSFGSSPANMNGYLIDKE